MMFIASNCMQLLIIWIAVVSIGIVKSNNDLVPPPAVQLLLFAPQSMDSQFVVDELERVVIVIGAAQQDSIDNNNNNRRNLIIRGRGNNRHLLDNSQEVITEIVSVRINNNINLNVLISLFRLDAEG